MTTRAPKLQAKRIVDRDRVVGHWIVAGLIILLLLLMQVLSAIGGLILIAGRVFYAFGYYTGGGLFVFSICQQLIDLLLLSYSCGQFMHTTLLDVACCVQSPTWLHILVCRVYAMLQRYLHNLHIIFNWSRVFFFCLLC